MRKTEWVPEPALLVLIGVPSKVEEILKAYPEYRVLELGRAFGIVKIITPEGNDYEIATFRTDIGKGRRPDSVEFATIEKDVNRRDLTMNALFYDISNKEIVDYVGGIQDIENKVVKTVGNAKERFDEDRLRILRALRFAVTKGFLINYDIISAMTQPEILEKLEKVVSAERIREEVFKMMKHDTIACLDLFREVENTLPGFTKLVFSRGLWLKPTFELWVKAW